MRIRQYPQQEQAASRTQSRPDVATDPQSRERGLALQRLIGNRASGRLLRVQGSSVSSLMQRAIPAATWQNQIAPYIEDSVWAEITADVNGARHFVRVAAGGGFEITADLQQWAATTAANLQANFTWTEKFRRVKLAQRRDGSQKVTSVDTIEFSTPAALRDNIDPGTGRVPMAVQDVDDRHNIVHHSFATYNTGSAAAPTRREGGHHLTVENAHLLLMHAIGANQTSADVDKRNFNKPAVNKRLEEVHGNTEIDNINFFPVKNAQKSANLRFNEAALPSARLPLQPDVAQEQVEQAGISLAEYLSFIQRALDSLPNVPPVYGAKILHTAQLMHQHTGLDPAQMFLKKGKGDHRHVVRAVMSIVLKGLVQGMNMPAEPQAIFSEYVNAQPRLPMSLPIDEHTEWVSRGNIAADGTTYNALETKWVDGQYGAILDALRAFIA